MLAQTVFTKQTPNKQTFMQVLLAKLKADNKFYAVKVLQKKIILKKKEVGSPSIKLFKNYENSAVLQHLNWYKRANCKPCILVSVS